MTQLCPVTVTDSNHGITRPDHLPCSMTKALQETCGISLGAKVQSEIDQRCKSFVDPPEFVRLLRQFVGQQSQMVAVELLGWKRGRNRSGGQCSIHGTENQVRLTRFGEDVEYSA